MQRTLRAWWQRLMSPGRAQPRQDAFLVEVTRAANQGDAALTIALLASEGIPAITNGESVGSVYGLQLGPLAELRILVRREHAALATEIIEQHQLEFDASAAEDDGWQDDLDDVVD